MRFVKPLPLLVFAIGVSVAAYLSRNLWLPGLHGAEPAQSIASAKDSAGPAEKIIVGDQAQKNLRITAQALKADVFWKSITVPGTVIDRPGVSDREIVAPAIGTVSQIYRAIGDTVRPSDLLFTIRLTSDTLHETQADLFKTTQNIKLAQERLKRLTAAGEGIAQARVIEVESEIKRLEAAAKSDRVLLSHRGLSPGDIELVAEGQLVTEIPVIVPAQIALPNAALAGSPPGDDRSTAYEFQELKVEAGQQVEAGQALCVLSNHQFLSIEGRAFRDELPLLEGSIKDQWPVDVDFQEIETAAWPLMDQTFTIRHIANLIDPVTRTFAFFLPLTNQSKTIAAQSGPQVLWRFRPGQKVWLHVRVEKLENVFVVPTDAVVREGLDAYVFTQNVNTFERKGVHVLFQDRGRTVIANDGSLPTYRKQDEVWTIPAIVQSAAAQLNRMTKAGSSGVPKGYHIHADGSLHKNEDEGK
jgi:multidrug efflux pump subunit AcrA (membrane-fusion protein)